MRIARGKHLETRSLVMRTREEKKAQLGVQKKWLRVNAMRRTRPENARARSKKNVSCIPMSDL